MCPLRAPLYSDRDGTRGVEVPRDSSPARCVCHGRLAGGVYLPRADRGWGVCAAGGSCMGGVCRGWLVCGVTKVPSRPSTSLRRSAGVSGETRVQTSVGPRTRGRSETDTPLDTFTGSDTSRGARSPVPPGRPRFRRRAEGVTPVCTSPLSPRTRVTGRIVVWVPEGVRAGGFGEPRRGKRGSDERRVVNQTCSRTT